VPAAWGALLAFEAALALWIDGPPGLLATPEERGAFQRLTDDAARNAFIADFWTRRDPLPSTRVNEFRQDFEARLEHVSEHLSEPGLPGWQTHRGRVYLVLGPPRSDLPRYVPNPDSGSMVPARAWSYGYERLGFQSALLFVDTFHNGHYWLLPPLLRSGDLRAVLDRWRNPAAAERFPSSVARALQRANRRAIQTHEPTAASSARGAPGTEPSLTVEPPPLQYKLARTAGPDRVLLSVTFEVPYERLIFVEQQGRLSCGLALYATVKGSDGQPRDHAAARERFEFNKEELERRAGSAYLRVLTLSAGPDAVSLELRAAWETPTPPAETSETIPLN